MQRTLFYLFIIIVTVFTSCVKPHTTKSLNVASCDLDSIRKRGKLIAVTDFNSTDYFIYKGEAMGFNYELLKSFSESIGIDLEIIPENHPEQALRMLKSGEADMLAYNLVIDSLGNKDIHFTLPFGETRQVLVQRKPRNWRALSADAIEKSLIRDQKDIAGKTIYVQAGSSHAEQLISLARKTGDSVNIIEVPFDPEKLIQNVSNGDIDYTVCDESLAIVNSTYFPGIDVSTPLGIPRNTGWGTRNNSVKLLAELNRWIATYKTTRSYAVLYSKYFKNTRSNSIVNSSLYALKTGKVSQYDDLIRQFSATINWDWRLLASLICQESRFDPNVESYAGAFGLMQVMPDTGKNFGIDITASPENNLKAGIKYIRWLHSIFNPKIPDEIERINFILAAYNAGPGHVLDAMKLTEKNGMNPQKWDGNVAIWLLKKSEPRYYNDTVVKNGYFRGIESVRFVSDVQARFERYKKIIPEEKSRPF